jgi:hypothetical protein
MMPDEATDTGIFTPHDRAPWLRLVQAVAQAFDLRKLVLAALGLVLLRAGWVLLETVFSGSPGATLNAFRIAGDPPDFSVDMLRSAAWRLHEPARVLAEPLRSFFALGQDAGSSLHALLGLLWAIVVWGLVGGAIARLALVRVSRLAGLSTFGAMRFALGHAAPLVATPLCGLLGVGSCALLCAGFGLLYRLPWGIGAVVGGVLLFIPLALGLVMTIMLVGLVAGWPLMHASVAAEAEDMLDALSRTYSYLNQRPVKFVGLAALAWLIGIPGLLAVDLLASSVVHLATWGLSLSAPAASLAGLDFPISPGATVPHAAAALQSFWRGAVVLLARGWIYAYFWTAASFVYLILRHDVDGTPLTDIKAGPPGGEPAARAR